MHANRKTIFLWPFDSICGRSILQLSAWNAVDCQRGQVDSFIAQCVYYTSICASYFLVYSECNLKLSSLVSRELRGEHMIFVHTHNGSSGQCCSFYLRGWWGVSAWWSVWTAGRRVWCFTLVSSILSQLPTVCRPGVLGIHGLRLQPRWALLYCMSAALCSQEIREEKSEA